MISVIIPSRNEDVALWATVASARADLETSGLEYEILVVLNGEYPQLGVQANIEKFFQPVFAGEHIDSPHSARHLGVNYAHGDTFFFLDAHVVLPSGFFRQVLADMAETGADIMHVPHRYLSRACYGYRTAWNEYAWGAELIREAPSDAPYRIAQMGHGAFAMRAETYYRIGGYWLALRGFGGEEPQLDLKTWMMGGSCWVTPRTYHWHYLPPGVRHTDNLFRDRNFVRNFLLLAAAYGEPGRIDAFYKAFILLHWQFQDLMPGLKEEVLADPSVAAERRFIAERAKYKDLAELKAMFDREGVIN